MNHVEQIQPLAHKPLTRYTWLSLLRAYGVILVLVYHFFPWIMPGGFIGVDVFFVFSGFLITSLLIDEFKKQGKVALLPFYERRFFRLFPAVLVMLLVVLPLTLTIPEDFRADLLRQVAAVVSWTTNFYEIGTGHSYGDVLLPHLFVHTWTLSIEMQYYLVWGLLVTALLPLFLTTDQEGRQSLGRSRLVVALLAMLLAVGSFVAMQVMLVGAVDPSAAYYSTFTHAYPILIGSVVGAFAGFGYNRIVALFERLNHPTALVLVVLSLSGIALMAIFLSFTDIFVYHAGLLLTSLLVALVILIGRGAQESLLQFSEPQVLRYLADRSYSIYLFHWPILIIVLVWAKGLFGVVQPGMNPTYMGSAFLALALTFVAAHLGYRFVERRFSRSVQRSAKGERDRSQAQENTEHREQGEGGAGIHQKKVILPPQILSKKPTISIAAGAEAQEVAPAFTAQHSLVRRVAVAVLVLVFVIGSTFSLATAPTSTSIERAYQQGLLELDLSQIEYAHQVLQHTGRGGNTEGAPRLLVDPGTITVVGDSVTIFPADDLRALTGAAVDAEVGRAMVNGIGMVRALQENDTLGEFVVIALATNAHADSYESAVTICEELQPGHKLIFVTAYGSPSMDELSAQLRGLPEIYPYVTIADWNAAIAGREDLLAADGYHLASQEAIDLYVEVIMSALEEAKHAPAR